jgi:hypothetical protein
VITELLVLGVGEERPIVHRVLVVRKTAVQAALLIVTDTQKGSGICDRERPKQHGVHQGEDGCSGSDAERKSENSGQRKGG